MNNAKNLILPGALAVAVLGGVTAGSLLNGLGASAGTPSSTSTLPALKTACTKKSKKKRHRW